MRKNVMLSCNIASVLLCIFQFNKLGFKVSDGAIREWQPLKQLEKYLLIARL